MRILTRQWKIAVWKERTGTRTSFDKLTISEKTKTKKMKTKKTHTDILEGVWLLPISAVVLISYIYTHYIPYNERKRLCS